MEHSLFFNNNAADNLATSVLVAGRSDLTMFNTTFEYNMAGTAPVASVVRASSLTIESSNFSKNVANAQVGALLVE